MDSRNQSKNTKTQNRSYHNTNGTYGKRLKKNYHVTSQTAYHITQLALQEGVPEGRIIDKIMRIYLTEYCRKYPNVR